MKPWPLDHFELKSARHANFSSKPEKNIEAGIGEVCSIETVIGGVGRCRGEGGNSRRTAGEGSDSRTDGHILSKSCIIRTETLL